MNLNDIKTMLSYLKRQEKPDQKLIQFYEKMYCELLQKVCNEIDNILKTL